MKKFFTLAALFVAAISANAQTEVWDASKLTDMQTAEQTIETSANITLKMASFLNEKDIQDNKTPWEIKGGEGTNMALDTVGCSPVFNNYIIGKGNPYVVDAGGHWEENEDGDLVWRDDPNVEVFTPGCGKLPVHGAYYAFTTKQAGSMNLAIYVNKGNHALYIVESSSMKEIANSDIKVKFFYQNNGFTFNDAEDKVIHLVEGTMPEDYIIQHTNGYTQNRPALGYMTFSVEANKTYYVFNPKSQLGIYGYEFTPSASGIEGAIVDNAQKTVVGYFSINGVKNNGLVKGLNIVKFSDGSSVKVIK